MARAAGQRVIVVKITTIVALGLFQMPSQAVSGLAMLQRLIFQNTVLMPARLALSVLPKRGF